MFCVLFMRENYIIFISDTNCKNRKALIESGLIKCVCARARGLNLK